MNSGGGEGIDSGGGVGDQKGNIIFIMVLLLVTFFLYVIGCVEVDADPPNDTAL